MDAHEVINRYYELANAGDWEGWCDLFAESAVIDEQLAGRVEGRETLRQLMRGFTDLYASFLNEPRHIVVSDDGQAAVVSHISATSPRGERVEAEVANYFRVHSSRIDYMANFHDTVPFRPVTGR